MVINEKKEILVVKEKLSAVEKVKWKLPGLLHVKYCGLVDPNEAIEGAAIREVFEETGIRTQFQSIVGFRHQSNYRFGQTNHKITDLYAICRLFPLNMDISICPSEIAAATWLSVYICFPNYYALSRNMLYTISVRHALFIYSYTILLPLLTLGQSISWFVRQLQNVLMSKTTISPTITNLNVTSRHSKLTVLLSLELILCKREKNLIKLYFLNQFPSIPIFSFVYFNKFKKSMFDINLLTM
ncbi:hypothetical protein RFI_06746 [Reticulomyxa filosa]|uniref:Nudix hydrolase domain-containing protein n=1 Tax=Reticulomyxa filosa TaxID=46433 RepID=X6NX42_RETFI|nr:hypothetical protein RFI_06746 [Reticulomyxa filosa]|eukprot:ETO30374.1 hypothetical protein RFI_06746 [Reticulomyxa filosa]